MSIVPAASRETSEMFRALTEARRLDDFVSGRRVAREVLDRVTNYFDFEEFEKSATDEGELDRPFELKFAKKALHIAYTAVKEEVDPESDEVLDAARTCSKVCTLTKSERPHDSHPQTCVHGSCLSSRLAGSCTSMSRRRSLTTFFCCVFLPFTVDYSLCGMEQRHGGIQ